MKNGVVVDLCRMMATALAMLMVGAAQTQANQTSVSSYRAAAQQLLDQDQQVRQLVEDADVPRVLRIAITVAPNGRVVKEVFIGGGGGNDERSAYKIMDEIGTMNFGAFTPDMPQTPVQFIWTLPRS